jgi:CMP-N-acetylneuraminic acid synthetase
MSINNDKRRLNVLAVIHARGGSKRIPNKNIKLLCGKPLITYCIKAALSSSYLDKVVVSTDSEAIKQIAFDAGAEVPFTRPDDLAEDVASELVTKHALITMEEIDGLFYDIVVTMQPTTPFILKADIDACIEQLVQYTNIADTVMTGHEMRELPTWARKIDEDGFSKNIFGNISQGDQGISQKQPKFYIANGGAYASTRSLILDKNMIVGPKTRFHLMPWERSIDIDEPIDFFLAEKVMEMVKEGRDINQYILNEGTG